MCCSADIFLGFLAILFPPLPVWVKCGLCSADSVINILLCVLGYLPGLIHAWYIIGKFPESSEYERVPQDGEEGGRVTYVFVQQPGQGRPKPNSQPHGGMNYGSTNNASSSSAAAQNGGSSSNGGGDNNTTAPPPPSYADAIKGDHKVQTQE